MLSKNATTEAARSLNVNPDGSTSQAIQKSTAALTNVPRNPAKTAQAISGSRLTPQDTTTPTVTPSTVLLRVRSLSTAARVMVVTPAPTTARFTASMQS